MASDRFITDSSFERQLMAGYRLTTAEIIYHMPDNPHILQSYLWQEYDIAPRFPVLRGFLDFWSRTLEGPLHSVILANRQIIAAKDFYHYSGEYVLN